MLIAIQVAQSAAIQGDRVQTWLTFMSGWVALGFLGLLGALILYYVFTGKIDLSGLINEPTGEASMSRFQLLIFTFVIAASLFLIVGSGDPPNFPPIIPSGILILLGISSSSYLVSKGIQFSAPEGLAARDPQVIVKGASTTTSAGGKTIQFQAEVAGLTDPTVAWSVDPASGFGTIDPSGLYTPPPVKDGPKPTGKVTIKATSVEDVSLTDIRNITLV